VDVVFKTFAPGGLRGFRLAAPYLRGAMESASHSILKKRISSHSRQRNVQEVVKSSRWFHKMLLKNGDVPLKGTPLEARSRKCSLDRGEAERGEAQRPKRDSFTPPDRYDGDRNSKYY